MYIDWTSQTNEEDSNVVLNSIPTRPPEPGKGVQKRGGEKLSQQSWLR